MKGGHSARAGEPQQGPWDPGRKASFVHLPGGALGGQEDEARQASLHWVAKAFPGELLGHLTSHPLQPPPTTCFGALPALPAHMALAQTHSQVLRGPFALATHSHRQERCPHSEPCRAPGSGPSGHRQPGGPRPPPPSLLRMRGGLVMTVVVIGCPPPEKQAPWLTPKTGSPDLHGRALKGPQGEPRHQPP